MQIWKNDRIVDFMTFLLLWHSLVWLWSLECNDTETSYCKNMSMTSVFLLKTLLKQSSQLGSSSQPQLYCVFLQSPRSFTYRHSNGF